MTDRRRIYAAWILALQPGIALGQGKHEPPVSPSEKATLATALEHVKAGRTESAITLLQEARGPSASAALDFLRGNLHFGAGELAEALAAYEESVRKFPNFRRSWQQLAMLRFQSQKNASAAAALQRVIALGGGTAANFGMLGAALSQTGDFAGAEKAFRSALQSKPTARDWQLGLLSVLFRRRQFAEVVRLADRMLEKTPGEGSVWTTKANALLALKQSKAAIEAFEAALRQGALSTGALLTLGDLYVGASRFEAATDAFVRALGSVKPSHSERYRRFLRVLLAQGRADQAKRLVAAMEEGELVSGGGLLDIKVRIATAEGKPEKAKRYLERWIAAATREDDPYRRLVNLGDLYRKAGQLHAAAESYREAQQVEPNSAAAYLRHAILLVDAKRFAEALKEMRVAQRLQPAKSVGTMIARLEQAVSQQARSKRASGDQAGGLAEKVKAAQGLVAENPSDYRRLQFLAKLYESAGKAEAARFCFRRAQILQGVQGIRRKVDPNAILFALTAEGFVLHNRRRIGIDDVRSTVARYVKKGARSVRIECAKEVPAAFLVKAIDLAKAGGAASVAVDAEPNKGR